MLSSTPTNIHKTTWYTSNIKRSELKEKKAFEYLQTLFYFSLNFLDSISHRLRLFISQSDCSSGWRIFLCPAKTKFWLNFLLIFKTCFDFSDNRKVYKRILLKQNVFLVFDKIVVGWREFPYVFTVLHRMNLCFEVSIQSLFLVYLKVTAPYINKSLLQSTCLKSQYI